MWVMELLWLYSDLKFIKDLIDEKLHSTVQTIII